MNIFFTILMFYVGASIGSFLSVLNYRIKHNKSGILLGRSSCPHCGQNLAAMDLIPIISYGMLFGKCRYCSKRISTHYVFLEFITGGVFLLLFLKYNFLFIDTNLIINYSNLIFFLISALVSSLLIAIAFYDLQYKEIPDSLSFTGIIIGLASVLFFQLSNLNPEINSQILSSLIAALFSLIFFEGQRLISKGKWIGQGDTFLALFMAIFLGWKLFAVALFAAYFIGAIVAIILLVLNRANLKTALPFAPFLVLGTFISIFLGNFIISTYITYGGL